MAAGLQAAFQIETPLDLQQEWQALLARGGDPVELVTRPVGPQNIVEWALPALLLITVAPSLAFYFQGFFTRLGEKTADAGVAAFAALFRKTSKVDHAWHPASELRKPADQRDPSQAKVSPVAAIRVPIKRDIGGGQSAAVAFEFILSDSLADHDFGQVFAAADAVLRSSGTLLDEIVTDISMIRSNPKRYLGVDRRDFVDDMLMTYFERRTSSLAGKYMHALRTNRWIFVN